MLGIKFLESSLGGETDALWGVARAVVSDTRNPWKRSCRAVLVWSVAMTGQRPVPSGEVGVREGVRLLAHKLRRKSFNESSIERLGRRLGTTKKQKEAIPIWGSHPTFNPSSMNRVQIQCSGGGLSWRGTRQGRWKTRWPGLRWNAPAHHTVRLTNRFRAGLWSTGAHFSDGGRKAVTSKGCSAQVACGP